MMHFGAVHVAVDTVLGVLITEYFGVYSVIKTAYDISQTAKVKPNLPVGG